MVKTQVQTEGVIYDRNNLPIGALLTGAKKLHDQSFTGKSIRVGVIDSGVDKDHPGFDGMVKKQKWYREYTPLSVDDHGTHVAGTIHFMAPDAELYDYRVFGAAGEVGVDEAIRLAIAQAVKDGCHVINMSLFISYKKNLQSDRRRSELSIPNYRSGKQIRILCGSPKIYSAL